MVYACHMLGSSSQQKSSGFASKIGAFRTCILARVESWMECPIGYRPSREEFETMPVYLTSEGLLTTEARAHKRQGKIEDCVITSRREWYAVASAWP
jgi:hypothetical protein